MFFRNVKKRRVLAIGAVGLLLAVVLSTSVSADGQLKRVNLFCSWWAHLIRWC